MKTHKLHRIIEFFILFIILPVSLATPYPLFLKILFSVVGFVYVLFVLHYKEGVEYNIKKGVDWKKFWVRVAFTFIFVVVSTVIYMVLMEPKNIFYVPLHHPLLFSFILFSYTLLSAWPQEILYRTFFFKRYKTLFPNKKFLVFLNAILFSLAHLFFRNSLVLLITFIGGIIFALTYLKFRSTTLVTIEHAIYGNWLYTVGLGYMLDFPGFDGN